MDTLREQQEIRHQEVITSKFLLLRDNYAIIVNTFLIFNRPSNLVRCIEDALELTPPRSSPESPDRSSSPDSDSLLMADRDNNTLPPRKRKLYFKDNQQANAAAPKSQARISSVIQFAKAS